MREIGAEVQAWFAAGQTVALATVVSTWGSSPRQPGAVMAVSGDGRIAGSVSGGCVEGAVGEAAIAALQSGAPSMLHFGVADEMAWEVGLACGGEIDVFVQPLEARLFARQADLAAAGTAFAALTLVEGPADRLGQTSLCLGPGRLEGFHGDTISLSVLDEAVRRLAGGASGMIDAGGRRYFASVHLPAPVLVVVGGVHIATALVRIAAALGYRTVVIDPRKAFGSETRFAHADRLLQLWPDEGLAAAGLDRQTAVAVLTHDPKLDDPALLAALRSDAFYVGALGSLKTQTARRERLRAAGLTDTELDRLHGPIGLDLGGRSPEEIALAIMAEIVQERNRS